MNSKISPLPLLRRTKLLPRESLPSLLERLTLLNYYSNSKVIEWLCCPQIDNRYRGDNIYRPTTRPTFQKLAQLTRISEEELFAASDHRFASVLSPPRRGVESVPWTYISSRQIITRAIIQSCIRSSHKAQFCPLCLSNGCYHQFVWVPVASAICLKHKCLLIQECPQCGSDISIAEIIKTQCKNCKTNLKEIGSISVADDMLGIFSQQLIQSCLTRPSISFKNYDNLPNCSPYAIYQLLDGLRLSLLNCASCWDNLPAPFSELSKQIKEEIHPLKKMKPEVAYYLYRAAFYAISNWPQGFYAFLDAYTLKDSKVHTSKNMTKRFGSFAFWVRYTYDLPEFKFLHQALLKYLLNRDICLPYKMIKQFRSTPWFQEWPDFYTPEHTAKTLGIPLRLLHMSQANEPLRSCLWSQCLKKFPIFLRKKVLELKKQWEIGIPVSHVTSLLGLYFWEIETLKKIKVLSIVSNQADNQDTNCWIFDKQSVVAFFREVDEQYDEQRDEWSCKIRVSILCLISKYWDRLQINQNDLMDGVAKGMIIL